MVRSLYVGLLGWEKRASKNCLESAHNPRKLSFLLRVCLYSVRFADAFSEKDAQIPLALAGMDSGSNIDAVFFLYALFHPPCAYRAKSFCFLFLVRKLSGLVYRLLPRTCFRKRRHSERLSPEKTAVSVRSVNSASNAGGTFLVFARRSQLRNASQVIRFSDERPFPFARLLLFVKRRKSSEGKAACRIGRPFFRGLSLPPAMDKRTWKSSRICQPSLCGQFRFGFIG